MNRILRGLPALILVISALVLPAGASLTGVSSSVVGTSSAAGPSLRSYRVKATQPNELVKADAPIADLDAQAKQRRNDALAGRLLKLQSEGNVQSFKYDSADGNFVSTLSDQGVAQLVGDPMVASVVPNNPAAPATVAPAAKQAPTAPTDGGVSSVNFIQVYTPFMWGKVNLGGLNVAITLLDSSSNVIGVPIQTTKLGGSVQIDRNLLYYETVFVNPSSPSQFVMIQPTNRVNVVTTGLDQNGQPATDDRTEVVDDVQAWTSYLNDSVSGHTSLPSATVFVTVATGSLGLTTYAAGSGESYAQTTADASGNFSVSKFQISQTSQPVTVDLKQNSTGFVRVQHTDLSEVYTYHGQNVLVLENSPDLHGYAFPLPTAPTGLATDFVQVTRPSPIVSITVNHQGGATEIVSFAASPVQPYQQQFNQTVLAGDSVQVSINGGPSNQVTMSTLTATINLGANQVSGNGPSNTSLTLGVGRIDGYITKYSTFNYVQQELTTSSGGSFTSSTISCGTSGNQILQPGGFGYVGFEDAKGNFEYLDFAAPRTDAMANFPFVEGWMALGTSSPNVTVRDASNTVKSQATAAPVLMWLLVQDLYINTYYNQITSQFVAPTDTVTVSQTLAFGATRTDTIPVDNLTTFVNTDDDTVVGTAPAGATLRTIPFLGKNAYRTSVASPTGGYTIANPYNFYLDSTCGSFPITQSFTPGAAGRTYLAHADGNNVFAAWGRSMNANDNENFVESYLYPTQNLDWFSSQTITSTAKVTPAGGLPSSVITTSAGLSSDAKAYVVDSHGQKVLIRTGTSVSVSFPEGPVGGPTRTATLSLASVPLITGSPSLTRNTLAGVGPPDWTGQATLTSPTGGNPVPIPARSLTAYGPYGFVNLAKSPITLVPSSSGIVSFTDRQSDRVWFAWAVTSYPVDISPQPRNGDLSVCGTAQPGVGITILNASDNSNTDSIGTGAADSSGHFCVTIDPKYPLYRLEVLLAQDANGIYSQPAIVIGVASYLPVVVRQ